MMSHRPFQRGVVFPLVLVLITTVTILMHGIWGRLLQSAQGVLLLERTEQAKALAEGGIAYGGMRLQNGWQKGTESLTVGKNKIQVQLEKYHHGYLLSATGQLMDSTVPFQKTIRLILDQNQQPQKWLED